MMKTINAVIPTATRIPAVTTQEEEIPSSEENVWSEWSEKRNASDDSKQTVRSEQISADEVISTPSSIFGLSSDGTTIMLPSTGEFSSSAAFPQDVIQDTSELCSQYNGTPVECLGLTGKAGCNLRSVPTIDGTLSYDKNRQQEYTHPSIVRKLHADITVYVYFSFINASSDKWYYVTCADGQTGFVLAKRIILDAK